MDIATSTRPLDWRSDFPAIPEGWAYLDSAATAQKPKPVIDAITRGYAETYATVHRGVYQRSSEMTLAFEAARRRIAGFIGAPSPDEVVFVRGATEGINLVAQSWGGTNLRPGDRIMLSLLEHHSNIVPWQLIAERTGAEIDVAPLTEDGRIGLGIGAGDRVDHRLRLLRRRRRVEIGPAVRDRREIGDMVERPGGDERIHQPTSPPRASQALASPRKASCTSCSPIRAIASATNEAVSSALASAAGMPRLAR